MEKLTHVSPWWHVSHLSCWPTLLMEACPIYTYTTASLINRGLSVLWPPQPWGLSVADVSPGLNRNDLRELVIVKASTGTRIRISHKSSLYFLAIFSFGLLCCIHGVYIATQYQKNMTFMPIKVENSSRLTYMVCTVRVCNNHKMFRQVVRLTHSTKTNDELIYKYT